MSEDSPFQAALDFMLHFSEQSVNLMKKAGPIIYHLRTNEEIQQFLKMVTEFYRSLPESVSMVLTVAIVFFSSLMVFRVGRSIISALVIVIQLGIIMAVAYIMWIMRDFLSAWLESVLN